MRETLDDLGRKFGTDKSSRAHNYLDLYERYFAPIRDEKINLLEIGVFNGASLAVWEAYFAKGNIIGADINPLTRRFARSRVAIEIIDQSNIEQLVKLGIKYGPFDVVIEDGSHFWEHQITTLKTLFPFVKAGGIYIVEDLQTNYGSMEANYRGVASISCVDYLKKLVDLRVADEQIDIAREEDPFLRTYGRAMETITFYRHACIMEKCRFGGDKFSLGVPFVSVEEDPSNIPVHVFAHIGNQGDLRNPLGWVRSVSPDNQIQGFGIEMLGGEGCELFYRARLANGEWTGWMTNGQFAGTRGKSQSLTGFSVRMAEEEREKFNLKVIGEFNSSTDILTVSGGEDCVLVSEDGALTGVQILLRKI